MVVIDSVLSHTLQSFDLFRAISSEIKNFLVPSSSYSLLVMPDLNLNHSPLTRSNDLTSSNKQTSRKVTKTSLENEEPIGIRENVFCCYAVLYASIRGHPSMLEWSLEHLGGTLDGIERVMMCVWKEGKQGDVVSTGPVGGLCHVRRRC